MTEGGGMKNESQLMCLTYGRIVCVVMSVRAVRCTLDRVLHPITAKGAYGNVTEELFVVTLLLCSLVPVWQRLAHNIRIPQRRCGGGGGSVVDAAPWQTNALICSKSGSRLEKEIKVLKNMRPEDVQKLKAQKEKKRQKREKLRAEKAQGKRQEEAEVRSSSVASILEDRSLDSSESLSNRSITPTAPLDSARGGSPVGGDADGRLQVPPLRRMLENKALLEYALAATSPYAEEVLVLVRVTACYCVRAFDCACACDVCIHSPPPQASALAAVAVSVGESTHPPYGNPVFPVQPRTVARTVGSQNHSTEIGNIRHPFVSFSCPPLCS